MTGLKRYMYQFLVGLLIFGLFPLSLSAQKTNDEGVIVVEMIRPPMDSVNNIKEYEFIIIKDKEAYGMVVIVYDDDGTPFKRKLDDDELKDLGYVEDVRDLHRDQIIGVDRLPDDTLILSYEDDDGIIVKQEITLDDAITLGLVESEDDLVDSEDEIVIPEGDPVELEDELTVPKDEPTTSEDELTTSEDEPTTSEDELTVPKDEPTTPEDELTTQESESQKEDETSDGVPMPSTATAIYNYLLLGAILIVLGSGLYIKQRKGD